MAEAHIAALLPTQNRVVSADENTAFLAHYDLNEHDVLRNIKAVGYDKVVELTSSYANLPNIDSAIFRAPFTLEVWINVNNITGDNPIFSIGVGAINTQFHSVIRAGKPFFGFWTPDLTGATTIAIGTWYHLALVYDGTSMIIYLNGVQDAIRTAPPYAGTVNNATLGSYLSSKFDGKMKDFRIYARAKTVTEIKESMYNLNLNEQGLRAYYKLNDNGVVLRDSSPFHNDIQVIGTYNWVKDINSVFTLRQGEGYFGGSAIAVEEGTTNIIPNPTINSLPTIGNTWGTYQTNQYNGGIFFSIGTVTDITNNVVTITWTPGVKFRTYDVVRPQTTGGGLTANTDYFIKMLSPTTFTIHQYDGSNDGSKGFAVHDSINKDIRIPIDITSFPTMWFGSPHKANSGLVKEIIRNGFSSNGAVHDCLRLYTNYADQTQAWGDHMAYNVTPTITASTQYTVSFYYRAVTPETVGKTGNFSMHNGVGFGGGSFTFKKEWQRYEAVVTSTATGGASLYWPSGKGIVWDIAEIQVEQKTFATSFTTGPRPSGMLSYPGSILNPSEGTISFWLKPSTVGYDNPIFTNGHTEADNLAFDLLLGNGSGGKPNGRFYYRKYSTLGTVQTTYDVPFNIVNTWTHVVCTWKDNTPMKLYINGSLAAQTGICHTSDFNGNFFIGSGIRNNNTFLMDELRIDKVERTDTEIAAWYYSNSPFWPRGIYRKPY